MAKSKIDGSGLPWPVYAALNFALLAAVAAVGFLAFLASLEIVLALSAPAVAQSIDSAVRAKYTLVTIRNVWLLVGGVIFLGLIIFCIDRYFKGWRARRLNRVFLRVLAFELGIILLQYLLAL